MYIYIYNDLSIVRWRYTAAYNWEGPFLSVRLNFPCTQFICFCPESPKTGAGNLPQLYPFPFAAEFLVLYQNFVRLVMFHISPKDWPFGVFVLLVFSHLGFSEKLGNVTAKY